MNPTLNKLSSEEQKQELSEAVFERLSDYLFDKILLLNYPLLFSSTPVTLTTSYGVQLRVPDTTAGRYIRPDRKARLRTVFYLNANARLADCYILSPALLPSEALPILTPGLPELSAYVGIRILGGAVSLVSRDSQGEQTKTTTVRVDDASTRVLEMKYNVTHVDVFIDNQFIGSISTNLTESIYNLVTLFPLMAPIRSTTGVVVSVNTENFQFLQDR